MTETTPSSQLDLIASLMQPLRWGLAAGLLTALVTLFLPNHYTSEARLLPVEAKGLGGNLGGLASAAAAFGVSVPGGDSSDANFVDILNSRSLKEQLLQTEFQFHSRAWRFGEERVEKQSLYDYLDETNRNKALKELDKVYSATRDLKSKVISIKAETKSPELAQVIVQKALAYLETFLKEKGRTRGGAKAAFAEARLAEARREMDEAEDAWRRFLEVNRNYQSISDPAVRLKGVRLETELRLRQQLVTTLAMNREQALLEEKNDIPILNLMDPADLPTEKSKPARSILVLLATMLVCAGSWIWLNREWVRARLLAEDDEAEPATQDPR
jgi:uncharacterized protein involved in exopolysaccharide biosynthesis